MSRPSPILALVLVGCVEPAGSRSVAITAGTEAPGLDGVVALTTEGELFCSGTVVGSRVVLTASHCLAQVGSERPIEVVFGARVDDPVAVMETGDRLRHPDWRFDSLVDDVAMVALVDEAPVDPVALSRREITEADEGMVVTIAGFGVTAQGGGGEGLRRSGEAPITGFSEERIWINGGEGAPSVCQGDSGGPSLVDEGGQLRVVGVHSRASCSSLSLDERVDRHAAAFIDPFIAEHAAEVGACSAGDRPAWGTAVLLAGLLSLRRRRSGRCRGSGRSRASCGRPAAGG